MTSARCFRYPTGGRRYYAQTKAPGIPDIIPVLRDNITQADARFAAAPRLLAKLPGLAKASGASFFRPCAFRRQWQYDGKMKSRNHSLLNLTGVLGSITTATSGTEGRLVWQRNASPRQRQGTSWLPEGRPQRRSENQFNLGIEQADAGTLSEKASHRKTRRRRDTFSRTISGWQDQICVS